MSRSCPVTGMGRRDFAMLLLIATYGLRPSEVVGLTLDDIKLSTPRYIFDPMLMIYGDSASRDLRSGRDDSFERNNVLSP